MLSLTTGEYISIQLDDVSADDGDDDNDNEGDDDDDGDHAEQREVSMVSLLNVLPTHNTFAEELLNHGLTLPKHHSTTTTNDKGEDLFHLERGYMTAPLLPYAHSLLCLSGAQEFVMAAESLVFIAIHEAVGVQLVHCLVPSAIDKHTVNMPTKLALSPRLPNQSFGPSNEPDGPKEEVVIDWKTFLWGSDPGDTSRAAGDTNTPKGGAGNGQTRGSKLLAKLSLPSSGGISSGKHHKNSQTLLASLKLNENSLVPFSARNVTTGGTLDRCVIHSVSCSKIMP